MRIVLFFLVFTLCSCGYVKLSHFDPRMYDSQRIAELDFERKVESIIKGLSEPDTNIRNEAFKKLVKLDKEGPLSYQNILRGKLVYTATNGDKEEQMQAVRVLTALNSKSLMDDFIAIYQKGLYPTTKTEAVSAIANIGDESVAPAIITFYQSEKDNLVKAKLIWAMGELGDSRAEEVIAKGLNDESQIIRVEAIRAIGSVSYGGAINALVSRWNNLSKFGAADEKAEMAKVLGKLKAEKAVDILSREVVISPSRKVRYACVNALGEIGSDKALPALASAMSDDAPEVAQTAHDATLKITKNISW